MGVFRAHADLTLWVFLGSHGSHFVGVFLGSRRSQFVGVFVAHTDLTDPTLSLWVGNLTEDGGGVCLSAPISLGSHIFNEIQQK